MSLPAHNMGKGKRTGDDEKEKKREREREKERRRTPRSLEVLWWWTGGLARRFCRLRFFLLLLLLPPFVESGVDGRWDVWWWLASPSFFSLSTHPLLEPTYLFYLGQQPGGGI
jgi:hypothetical protein